MYCGSVVKREEEDYRWHTCHSSSPLILNPCPPRVAPEACLLTPAMCSGNTARCALLQRGGASVHFCKTGKLQHSFTIDCSSESGCFDVDPTSFDWSGRSTAGASTLSRVGAVGSVCRVGERGSARFFAPLLPAACMVHVHVRALCRLCTLLHPSQACQTAHCNPSSPINQREKLQAQRLSCTAQC